MAAIETNGLTKVFGESVVAVDNLDLEVERGEVYGFLGHNGAGKSTTINLLLDFLHPTSGSACVLGHDTRDESIDLRKRIGVLPEGTPPYERLTAREHLEFTMEIKGVDGNPDEILDRVGLDPEDADRNAGEYSKGMAQRLGLGMALVGDPDLLILDEPSSGLDPTGMAEMRRLIREEADDGTAVFFSSHILSEVEAVCDRIGILNSGRLVAVDTIEGLRSSADVETVMRLSVPHATDTAVQTIAGVDGVNDAWVDNGTISVSVAEGTKFGVLNALDDAGVTVDDFAVEESSLEDLFAKYASDDQRASA